MTHKLTHDKMTHMTETEEARNLVALYTERRRMTAEMANHPRPTGAMAQAVLDKGAELDAACEAFRRKHYPRKFRVVVGGYAVLWTSRTNRSIGTIYEGFAEFAGAR